jgi:hypothetical protein
MVDLTAEDLAPRTRWSPGFGNAPRAPTGRDRWFFFVGLPLFFALWATAVGIGPARVLPFHYGFLYIATQMTAAFCVNGLAAYTAALLLRRWPLPLWQVLLCGYALSWAPLYTFYLQHFHVFCAFFPEIIAPTNRPPAGMTAAYLLHVTRYSLPFAPMWLGAVYGYRFVTGVQFFVKPGSTVTRVPAPASPASALTVAAFMAESRLPAGEKILAVAADEHYIRVWTASGSDMIRYRFSDAVGDLADRDGAQVHRSWWIDWSAVTGYGRRGKSVELMLANGLKIPVSLAYKAEVLRRMDQDLTKSPA